MKKAIRFLVLFCLSLAIPVFSAAPVLALPASEQPVSDFVVEFLNERAFANLGQRQIDYETYAVTRDDLIEDVLPLSLTLDAQTKYKQENLRRNQLTVSNVSTTYNVQSVDVDGKSAHLSVLETVGMRYAGLDEDSAATTRYEVDCVQTDGGWKVSNLSYGDHTAEYGIYIEQPKEISAQVLGLLNACADAEYDFGSLDFTKFAVSAEDVLRRGKDIASVNAPPVPAFEPETAGELPLADYLREKFSYIQHTRRAENLAVSNLSTTYRFLSYKDLPRRADGAQRASVSIFETVGMRYADLDEDSAVSKTYEIELIRTEKGWKVYALSSDDYRDEDYWSMLKNGGAESAIAAYDQKMRQKNEVQIKDPSLSESLLKATAAQNSYLIGYNQNFAAIYASQYCTSTGINTQSYYNPNFHNYTGEGGDCMNFASQCVFAGFSGSDDNPIDTTAIPMDRDGANSVSGQWYKDSASWTGTLSFQSYVNSSYTNCNSGNNLQIDKYTFQTNSTVPTSQQNYLLGSVVMVRDLQNDIGHAMVVTKVTGGSLSQIYVTAHTNDVKLSPLSQHCTSNDEFYVLRPVYYKLYANQMPLRVITQWKDNKPSGTTETFTATAHRPNGGACYRMAMMVVTPSGKVHWIAEQLNTSSISGSIQLTEKGLYKISAYARETASSPSSVGNTIAYRTW